MDDDNKSHRSIADIVTRGLSVRPGPDMSAIHEQQAELSRLAGERIAREQRIADAAEHSLNAASYAVGHLVEEIGLFEQKLSEHEEVALYVIGGPAGQSFFPTVLKALNPDKVLYGGADQAGRPFVVVQHVSQLNFAMTATVFEEGQKPRRVGVLLENNE